MPALTGKVARIRYTSAGAAGSTNEAATLSTDLVTVTIDDVTKRHWDSNSTLPRVYSSTSTGTALARTLYNVNYVQGKAVFKAALSSTKTYVMDVSYLTASYLTGGRNWELEVETEPLDVTAFSTVSTGQALWRRFKPGLSSWRAKIGRIASTGTTGPLAYDRIVAAGDNLIVELVVSGTGGEKYEGRARFAGAGIGADIGGLVTEDLELAGNGQLYYSTV